MTAHLFAVMLEGERERRLAITCLRRRTHADRRQLRAYQEATQKSPEVRQRLLLHLHLRQRLTSG